MLPPENMLNFIRKIFGRRYCFLNIIEVSKIDLTKNYQYLRYLNKNLQIAPVLKSNAYGHGLLQVAKVVAEFNPPFICVDSLHEAYHLYKNNIKTPILIMGYIDPDNLSVKKLPFSYAVYSLDYLEKIHRYQPQAEIHLKIDSGMHRMGIYIDELNMFLEEARKLPGLKVAGLMSHLATINDPLFSMQLKNFQSAKEIVEKFGFKPSMIHLGASEAILNSSIRNEVSKVSNIVRVGKALYGYSLTISDSPLKPVLTLKTKIAQIKKLKKGDSVGYDGTFSAKKNMVIAVLPIGYFDGIDRRLSNKGSVTINGVRCKIIGRVSMNVTVVDISKVDQPSVGQEVIVYANNPKCQNSILNTAILCDTIPHEILVHLAESTTRVIV